MEILGKKIYFINRKKLGKNINIDINKNLKLDIYSHLKIGLTEGSIIGHKKAVVGWWKTKNIQKNPLLK